MWPVLRRNESECTRSNFELQTKKGKYLILVKFNIFHKNVFIKPSSSNPKAPNSDLTSKMIFIWNFLRGGAKSRSDFADFVDFKQVQLSHFCPIPINNISFWRSFNGECENKNNTF